MTKDTTSNPRAEKFAKDAAAVRAKAAIETNPELKASLEDGARALEGLAAQAATPQPTVLRLAADSTPAEITKARQRSSVRVNGETFLPVWSSSSSALPDVFLRCGLFSVREGAKAISCNSLLIPNDRDNMALFYTGTRLSQYDRRVYAACLNFYKTRPLRDDADVAFADFVQTSFYKFIVEELGATYSKRAHDALLASLRRLSDANIRIRVTGDTERVVHLSPMLTVEFESPLQERKNGRVSEDHGKNPTGGRARIVFSLSQTLAELFGASAWSTLPIHDANNDVIELQGLTAWLAGYFSTHSKSAFLPILYLFKISGYARSDALYRNNPKLLASDVKEFKKALKRSLETLEKIKCPKLSVSIVTYTTNDCVRIELGCWKKGAIKSTGTTAWRQAQ